ncbi:hypothetical protein F4818DRAFT_457618 [Hypoxylon cercidicola]|nr:hypothetical protein F4818DRAFT_457618 [Hypoxylon cercidicola]
MSRRQSTHINIRHRSHTGPISDEASYSEEDTRPGGESYDDDDDDDWSESYSSEEDDDDIDPEDSASTNPARRSQQEIRTSRPVSRQHQHRSVAHRAPSHYDDYRQPPNPSNSLDSDYDYYGRGAFGPPAGPNPPYYGGRGAYPQSHVGGYGHPFAGSGPVVPYGPSPYQQNPFAPANGAAGNYFNGEHRWPPGGNEMMPFGAGPAGQSYFGGPPYPPLPHGMQQYQWSPPPPPPTDIGQPRTPAPEPPKEDPEKEAMKKRLAEIEAERKKAEAEAKRKEIEAQIRKEAELAFQRQMEQMKRDEEVRAEERRIAEVKAKEQIESIKKEAQRVAQESIELEKKAAAERAKKEAEAIAKAERSARDKLEAERKAEEERKKREAETIALIEAQAKAKVEAAVKADAIAKAAAQKKLEEEIEWRKKMEEEAKAKAELEARKKVEAEEAAKAAAAKKAAEEAAERKRIEEDAKIKAELDARKKVEDEKAAAEAAKAAEDAKKKEEDAFKKRAFEEAKLKAEEANKKSLGKDKAPIRFKDAVGRKFSFPFHLCQTWQGMEELIKQAFLHVDVIGPHVQAGHYDLIGPNGEIILPQVWEKVIEPDWAVTMHMWPMDRPPMPQGLGRPAGPAHMQMPGGPGRFPANFRMPGARAGGPPAPPHHGMGGPGFMPQGAGNGRGPGGPPNPVIIPVERPKKPSKKVQSSGVLGWLGGGAKSSKTKRSVNASIAFLVT